MATISVRQVWKAYDELPVIHGIDLEVEDGALVALVGPSGCGKSTLLRMIAGLEDISDGEIAIGELVVNEIAPKDRDIAMVFQNYALYPHKTVAENMGFSLRVRGYKKSQTAERVGEAAKMLGLEELLERYPRQLSGGQRQRVAMGRAIVRKPSVFLFDEPLSNLDAKLRVQMRSEIKALHQRLKTTTVYVTHDQIEAMTLADEIIVMQDGVIKQVGAPLDLYDRPANLFVAGFIGSPTMNFFEGHIADGVFMTDRGAALPLPDNVGIVPDERLIYGIRPEHIALSTNGLAANVELVEPTGPEIMIEADVAGHHIVASFKERHKIQPGEQLHIVPDRNKAHMFVKADGRALRYG